jgi:hypothetical protein
VFVLVILMPALYTRHARRRRSPRRSSRIFENISPDPLRICVVFVHAFYNFAVRAQHCERPRVVMTRRVRRINRQTARRAPPRTRAGAHRRRWARG